MTKKERFVVLVQTNATLTALRHSLAQYRPPAHATAQPHVPIAPSQNALIAVGLAMDVDDSFLPDDDMVTASLACVAFAFHVEPGEDQMKLSWFKKLWSGFERLHPHSAETPTE